MRHSESRQQGVVLLAILLVLLLTGSSLLLGALNKRQDLFLQRQAELQHQMQVAKQALLSYAANTALIHGDRGPGFLPCPDMNNDGQPESTCNGGSQLGRLPQYLETAGQHIAFNGYYADLDQQFWYAVSPNNMHQSSANDSPLRTSAQAPYLAQRFNVDGADDIVALLIAPGEALSSQDRLSAPNDYRNYLDASNGASQNYSGASGNPEFFNDQIVTITHDELMIYVGLIVAKELKNRLDAYLGAFGNYPPQDSLDFINAIAEPANWVSAENWDAYDQTGERYIPTNIVYRLDPSGSALLAFAGCPDMRFTLQPERDITRIGNVCGHE